MKWHEINGRFHPRPKESALLESKIQQLSGVVQGCCSQWAEPVLSCTDISGEYEWKTSKLEKVGKITVVINKQKPPPAATTKPAALRPIFSSSFTWYSLKRPNQKQLPVHNPGIRVQLMAISSSEVNWMIKISFSSKIASVKFWELRCHSEYITDTINKLQHFITLQ